MGELTLYLIAALVIIILLPLVPRMVKFSIAVLKILKWKGLAELYLKHFKQLVSVVRIMMLLIIVILLVLILIG